MVSLVTILLLPFMVAAAPNNQQAAYEMINLFEFLKQICKRKPNSSDTFLGWIYFELLKQIWKRNPTLHTLS